ncbi:MAG TPA: hypothetical protein VFJ58_08455 [Armatimonadota bacterium]|nr:hypothetical protein [Armatimonadota bacterium]
MTVISEGPEMVSWRNSSTLAQDSSETIEAKFERLASEWTRGTSHLPSVTRQAMHPAYQEIIGMGPAALPLILRRLRREPDHWFWALEAITGANPVPSDVAGDVPRMAEAWIAYLSGKSSAK